MKNNTDIITLIFTSLTIAKVEVCISVFIFLLRITNKKQISN